MDALQRRSHNVYVDLLATVGTSPHPDSTLVGYHVKFAEHVEIAGPKWIRAKYLNLPLSFDKVNTLARFRLSNHFLAVEMGRWHRPEPVPVAMRMCALCASNTVQDEHHHFFACPALQGTRDMYPRLFAPGSTTHLRELFTLRNVAFADRAVVARDICCFLPTVGGVYATPPGAAP